MLLWDLPSLRGDDHVPHPSGRLQSLRLTWAGHAFTLVNTYWPSTGAADRARFLEDTLQPALALLPPAWVVGDFNFTPGLQLDRLPHCAATANADAATHLLLSSALPEHTDAFRHLHPTVPGYTFSRPSAMARLDRVHLPAAAVRALASAQVHHTPCGDHHALSVSLIPAVPVQPLGPGRRAIPSTLTDDPAAAAELAAHARRAVAYGMGLDDAALLAWWPGCQRAYLELARMLTSRRARTRREAQQALQEAQQRAALAQQAVPAAAPSQLGAALAAAARANRALRLVSQRANAPAAAATQSAWLLNGERPSPLVTSLVRPRTAPQPIASLVARDGTVLRTNRGIADGLAQHYAAISASPVVDRAAQQRVLAALQAAIDEGAAAVIPAELAAAAGADTVTEDEVRAALRAGAASSSSGLDGLPYTVWRVGDGAWAPLLANLFTAMGRLDSTPPGFTRGTITPLVKPNALDATSPASYRPITLLPTLYRIQARILARRFGRALAPAIGPEQSAYLPGRLISDNTTLTDLLPHVMASAGLSGATVFLDVAKAFDTVDRSFLFQALAVMGASPGMVRWARLLLRDTWASVHANGTESRVHCWHAGVRQGCPLSPVLYLVIAQALSAWLRAQPELGLVVDGVRYVATQHADDTQVHLSNLLPATVAALIDALRVFALATGQHTNADKSVLVSMGVPPAQPLPTNLSGLPVRHTTTSLGVPVADTHPPVPAPAHPGHPYATRGADRPRPRPPPPAPATPAAWTRGLVGARASAAAVMGLPLSVMGRGMATASYAASRLLYLAEAAGLPAEARTFFATDLPRMVCRHARPDLLVGPVHRGGFGLLPIVQHLQGRAAAAACRLLRHLTYRPGQPGSQANRATPPPPWVHLASGLLRAACPTLHPAQALLASTLASPVDAAAGLVGPANMPLRSSLPPGPLTRMVQALQALGGLSAPGGVNVSRLLTRPAPGGVPDLTALGWAPAPGRRGTALRPAARPVPVSRFTALLFASPRPDQHTAYVRLALGSAAGLQRALASFGATLRRASRLPIDARVREVLWLLAIDAIPGGRIRPFTCPCSHPGHPDSSGRRHSFWDCPVAVAVRDGLEEALGRPLLGPASLWLLAPPPGTCAPAWQVIALTALHAMEHGRRRLWALHHQAEDPGAALVLAASRAAVGRFWLALDEFAWANPRPPAGWELDEASPVLFVRDGRLCVRPLE